MPQSRFLRNILYAGLALLVLFLLTAFGFLGNLASGHREIDITTGRIRQTNHLMFFGETKIEDSPLTKMLELGDFANKPSDWRTIHASSFGDSAIVCYRFGGVEYDMRALVGIWLRDHYSESMKRESVLKLLEF